MFLEPYVKTAVTGFYLERIGRLPLPGEQPVYHEPPKAEPANDYPPEPEERAPAAPRQGEAPGAGADDSRTEPEWI